MAASRICWSIWTFKGTRRRDAFAIAEEIEDVGGHLNAYTAREQTAYYAKVLSEDAPLAIDLWPTSYRTRCSMRPN